MSLPVEEQRQARRVRELVSAAGGVENCEDHCGKAKSLFSGYQSPNDSRSIPLRDIELLESVTHGKAGHPIVTRYLAGRAGYTLVRRPVVTAEGADLLALLGKQAKAKGRADSRICTALADDHQVDEAEAIALIPHLAESLEITAQMLAEIEAIAGRPVP